MMVGGHKKLYDIETQKADELEARTRRSLRTVVTTLTTGKNTNFK